MRTVTLAIVACCAACGIDNPTTISGTMTLTATSDGSYTFQPFACLNGDTRDFYGVDLVDNITTLRLIQDPIEGWVATLTKNGDPSVPDARWLPSACGTFQPQLIYDHDTRAYCTKNSCDEDEDDSTQSGYIALDCMWPGGGNITGRIDFAYCDNPGEPQ